MAGSSFSLILTLCFSITVVFGNLNEATVADIRRQVREMINADPIEAGLKPNDLRMIGGLIRLSFHDCVGNACDGCINRDNPENAGLESYITRAELLYNDLQVNGEAVPMSRADFWALAGIEAVTYSMELARFPDIPNIKFQTGRVDCVTSNPVGSPWTPEIHEFPSPHGSARDTVKFFRETFGFDAKQTTAIIGAHTVGRAHREASGFNHPWVQRKDRFDNQFYIDMKDASKGWNQQNVGRNSDPKILWESTRKAKPITMMLNADMSLMKDLGEMTAVGQASCTYSECPDIVGSDGDRNTGYWVDQFANDNSLFIREFAAAFEVMISHGYEQLNDLDP